MTITATSTSGSPRRAARIGWTLAASCLAVAAAVIVPAGPASAAVCDGVSCNGQDPNQAGCAGDAINAAPPVVDQGVTLELRYSPSCHANWARITPAKFNWHFFVLNDNGNKQEERVPGWPHYDSYHTNMVNGNVKSWACFDDTVCTKRA
jgi:hypothetical protein